MPTRIDQKEKDWQRRVAGDGIQSLNSEYLPADSWDDVLSSNKVLQYPKELGYSPDLKNYILFDFYDTGGDALIQQKSSFMTKTEELIEQGKANPGLSNIVDAEALQKLQEDTFINFAAGGLGYLSGGLGEAAAAYAAASFITSGNAKNFLDAFVGANSTTRQSLQNARAGKSLNSFSSTRLGFADKVKRINLSIALPMTPQLNSSYSMEYAETDFTNMVVALSAAKNIQGIAGSLGVGPGIDKDVDEMREMSRKLGAIPTALAEKVSGILGSGAEVPLDQFQQASNRQAPNKFNEQLFKGVGRRSFSFSWELIPLSKEDVLKIYSIVYAFKKYSHPKLSSGGLFLDFPGQFKIGFFTGTKQNDFLFRMGMCACTKVEVTYGGKDLNFFRDFMATIPPASVSGAAPNSIKLSLEFTELELLTRERIQQGY